MINNDSILNQLNNYKKLNNAGVGITMRSYPTYVERYYPIEDVLKIIGFAVKFTDDPDAPYIPLQQYDLVEYEHNDTDFPQRKNIKSFAYLEQSLDLPNECYVEIHYSINGEEYSIEFNTKTYNEESVTIDNYSSDMDNLNSITFEFHNPDGSDSEVVAQDGTFFLLTDWSMIAIYQVILAHTEFMLKYKPNLTEEYTASCNLALVFKSTAA